MEREDEGVVRCERPEEPAEEGADQAGQPDPEEPPVEEAGYGYGV